jgi:hypothetical protein
MRPLRIVPALLAILTAPLLQAQTLPQAETFVRQLYDQYEHPSTPGGPDVFGKMETLIFSPGLLAVMRKADRATPKGEVGKLDGDPVCDCQEMEGIKVKQLHTTLTGKGRATAIASLLFPSPETREIRLYLLWTAKGWRIDDIGTKDTPSLRKYLLSPVN